MLPGFDVRLDPHAMSDNDSEYEDYDSMDEEDDEAADLAMEQVVRDLRDCGLDFDVAFSSDDDDDDDDN